MRKVPELRFAGFDGEWEEKEFSENFDTTIPKNSLSRDKLTNQVTRVKNIHYGDIHKIFDNVLQSSNERIPHIINDDLSTHERYFLQDGDIIFTDAAEDNTAGKCVELDIDDVSNIVAGLHTIPARPIKFGKYFYGFYLNSNSFHNKIIPLLEGTKVSSISKSNLNTLSVIVPKVEEQEKIGDLFKKIEALIEVQEGKVSKLEDFKKSMLQKVFPKKGELVPEFRFDGFDEEWKNVYVKDIGSFLGGTSIESYFNKNGDYKVISIGSYSNSSKYIDQGLRVDLNDKTKSKLLSRNDLAMVLNDKTTQGNIIGRALLIDEDNKYIFNQRTQRISPNIDKYSSLFLYYLFNSDIFRNKIKKISQGNTQIYVNWPSVESISLKIPTKKEQEKIGQFFKNLDTQIENEEKLLDSYKMMKKSLLQKMFV